MGGCWAAGLAQEVDAGLGGNKEQEFSRGRMSRGTAPYSNMVRKYLERLESSASSPVSSANEVSKP